MNEDLDKIQFSPVRDYKYADWFKTVKFNHKILNSEERKVIVDTIDDHINLCMKGLPMLSERLNSINNKRDSFSNIERTMTSISLFIAMTMADSMVACKYFLIADKDYDRRFMRGKLKVILNEGFKKLYGFNDKNFYVSEWAKLLPLMKYFPETINLQYQEMTSLLEKHSKSSSWWREERNVETHLDTDKLFLSRDEEIIESKVMMDCMKLFNTLLAVNHFMTNANACSLNFLLDKYKRGELKE